MRKALFVAAVAAALSVAAPAAAHAAGTDTTSRGDQLTGLGTLGDFGNPTAYLAAVGTKWGAPGAFTITYPDGTYAIGASTCLVVAGKVAYITGKVALSGGPPRAANGWNKGS